MLRSKIDTSLKVIAKWDKNTYYFTNIAIDDNKLEKVVYNTTTNNDLDLIHKRLNHLSKDYLIKTLENTKGFNSNIQELNKIDLNDCKPCIYGKSHEITSYKPLESPKEILTYFDIDIASPFKNIGLKGERYFITFTCRSTRAIWVYALKYRSQALDKLKELVNLIKNQFNINIKGIYLDNAKEFFSSLFIEYCTNKGIILDPISPYAHSQNGIAERLNRYIIE